VRISYNQAKRTQNLEKHGVDFADADAVFAGRVVTMRDRRHEYGEERFQTYGYLNGRMMVVVWTPRDDRRRIISMRKCNAREQARIGQQFRED
jgi:hypothetical protein